MVPHAIKHIQSNLKIEAETSFETSVGLPIYQTTRRNLGEDLQNVHNNLPELMVVDNFTALSVAIAIQGES
jgi:Flp pilus assembly protein TadB